VSIAHFLTRSSKEIEEECDRWNLLNSKIECFLTDKERELIDLYMAVYCDLLYSELKYSVKAMSNKNKQKSTPQIYPRSRILNLGIFTDEARIQYAIVWPNIFGKVGREGIIQSFLCKSGVIYIGSNSTAMAASLNLVSIVSGDIVQAEISILPQHILIYEEIITLNKQDLYCQESFVYIQRIVSPIGMAFCVSALYRSNNLGIARICNSCDLAIYVRAVRYQWQYIPSGLLSVSHKKIKLPKYCSSYLFKMDTTSFSSIVWKNSNNSIITPWTLKTNWLKVSIILTGSRGHMIAVEPFFDFKNENNFPYINGDTQTYVKSIPIFSLTLAVNRQLWSEVQKRVELVAYKIKVSGIVKIDALIECESGQLEVISVNSIPCVESWIIIKEHSLAVHTPLPPQFILLQMLESAHDDILNFPQFDD